MQPAMLPPVSICNRTGSFGGIVAQKGNRGENSAGQMPAATASALVLRWRHWVAGSNLASPVSGCAERLQPRKVRDYERTAKIGRICSRQDRSAFLARSKWQFFDW